MKKLILMFVSLCGLFLLGAVVSAEDQAQSSTVKGWVADARCGIKGASASGEACTRKCLAKGEKMVLVTDGDQKVLKVENPDSLKGHEGHHIAVTGHVSGESVHVESASML